MLARVLEPQWVVNSSWLTCSPDLQTMPGSLVGIPSPLPCFSETAGSQVELHVLYKEKGSTEMLGLLGTPSRPAESEEDAGTGLGVCF